MSELGIIRQYMVVLGFQVDDGSLTQAQDSLNAIAKTVTGFSSTLQDLAIASGAIAGIGAADVLNQFTLGVANATLQNEMFAREMWMGYDSAVAFSSSLKALGTNIQSLYLSPTLMNAFIQFRQLAQQMQTPGDFQSTMAGLQQITFQFDEFKLEASYAIQWVGYALAKQLSGPLGDFQGGLQKLNTWIITNMPQWTAQVAAFIAKIAGVFEGIYKYGKDFVDWWDSLGSTWQHIIEISAGLVAALASIYTITPIITGAIMGLATAFLALDWPLVGISVAILAFILLLQDLITYSKGGQSAFPGLWAWVNQMAKSPEIGQLGQSFQDLGKALQDLATAILDLIGGQAGEAAMLNWSKIMTTAFEGLVTVITAVVMGISSIADGITIVVGEAEKLLGLVEKNPKLQAQGSADVQSGETNFNNTWSDQPTSSKKIQGKASGGPAEWPHSCGRGRKTRSCQFASWQSGDQ